MNYERERHNNTTFDSTKFSDVNLETSKKNHRQNLRAEIQAH